jgi:hypothetical protein
MHHSDIERRRFLTTLPSSIDQYINDHKRPHGPKKVAKSALTPLTSPTAPQQQQNSKKTKTNPFVNKMRQYNHWRLPTNNPFGAAFGGGSITNLPKGTKDNKSTPFCLKAFAIGECPRESSCPFLHEDPENTTKRMPWISSFGNSTFSTVTLFNPFQLKLHASTHSFHGPSSHNNTSTKGFTGSWLIHASTHAHHHNLKQPDTTHLNHN